MAFYRFHICDPIHRVDGYGHDGAALADDIDAMVFAASIVQGLLRQSPQLPRNWAIKILRGSRQVGILTFEAGCRMLLRTNWLRDRRAESHEAWRQAESDPISLH
jgi:hypothetical protein